MHIIADLDCSSLQCSHSIMSICNIYLFPALVLRAGFAFCLLQFLFTAFLLLFFDTLYSAQLQRQVGVLKFWIYIRKCKSDYTI